MAGAAGPYCPLPSPWEVDWSLRNSTAVMPELQAVNNVSWTPLHPWGYASLDWGVGRSTWLNASDLNASTCEATSIANCAAAKASGSVKRCGIYHNVELALQWLESNRAVMYDPGKVRHRESAARALTRGALVPMPLPRRRTGSCSSRMGEGTRMAPSTTNRVPRATSEHRAGGAAAPRHLLTHALLPPAQILHRLPQC